MCHGVLFYEASTLSYPPGLSAFGVLFNEALRIFGVHLLFLLTYGSLNCEARDVIY
jgi:hypothetical protein